MQSGESARNTAAVSDQVSGLAGMARRLVLKQLEALPHGAVRIEEPDGNVLNLGSGSEGGVIQLRDWRTYSMMMSGGALGAAEAYMEGGWDSPDLVAVIRYFAANIQAMRALEGGLARLSNQPSNCCIVTTAIPCKAHAGISPPITIWVMISLRCSWTVP